MSLFDLMPPVGEDRSGSGKRLKPETARQTIEKKEATVNFWTLCSVSAPQIEREIAKHCRRV